ncbi:MAG: alpha/beta fold hydrolase [Bacteroidia bacterium]
MIIALMVRWYQIKENYDPNTEKSLRTGPDGVESWIGRPDGTVLRALHKGSGIPVVLIHDAGISSVSMNLMWKLLAGYGFKVITFDQRGHGFSTVGRKGINNPAMVEDLEAILAHFKVWDGILVGHSSGAFLTIQYLLKYQEQAAKRIKGAVSIAGFAGNILAGTPQNRFARGLIETGLAKQLLQNRFLAFGYATTFFDEATPFSRIRVWIELAKKHSLKALLPILPGHTKENFYDRLGEIQTPYIVAASPSDRRLTPEHSVRMAAALPNARLEWVKDAGNMMVWECPGQIVDMVRSLAKAS